MIDRREFVKTIFGTLLVPSAKPKPGQRVLRLHPNEYAGDGVQALQLPIDYASQILGLCQNQENSFVTGPLVSAHDARRLALAVESLDQDSFVVGLVCYLCGDPDRNRLREFVEFLRLGELVVEIA